MIRRTVTIGLLTSVVVIGISASISVFFLARRAEEARIRGTLEVHVQWRSADIEHRLRDGLLPVAALVRYLSSHPDASQAQIEEWTARTAGLGIPVNRLGWEPLVRGPERTAFEQAARAAGWPNYEITELTEAGTFVRSGERDVYFPVRFERRRPNSVSSLGFDLRSEPHRRDALDRARDTGQPVAIRPRLRLATHDHDPYYVVYWPLFGSGEFPATVEARRAALTGYVTAVILLVDALEYAIADVAGTAEHLVFTVENLAFDEPEEIVASSTPDGAIRLGTASSPTQQFDDAVFRRTFDILQQRWSITFRFPRSVVLPMRTYEPWAFLLLGLVLTAAVATTLRMMASLAEVERKRHRETIDLMQRLEETNTALASANARLGERERAATEMAHTRTRFLASASHDLRQPLHALALFASALQRRVSDPVGRELVGNISDVTLSMQQMFTTLLDLSRLDAQAVAARLGICDPEALLGKLAAEFSILAEAGGIALRRAGQAVPVTTDLDLLESVLRNLLGNAVKFTAHGGVLLAARPRRTQLRIEIWDTGCGIAAEDIDRIFEEFERVDTGTRTPGFGLGLPIVQRLCTLIGARIEVCSKPGQGSRFSIVLERSAECGRDALAAAPLPEIAPGTRVLIVDNDDDVQRALSIELEDLGCDVQSLEDGEKAVRLLQLGDTPDIVLLDLQLGKGRMDGWAVVAALRSLHPSLKIVLVTGSTDAVTLERVRCSELPALFKPVRPDVLGHLIANLTVREARG